MPVDEILESGESHFLDLVGKVGSAIGLTHGALTGTHEFAHLRDSHHIAVHDGRYSIDDLGLLTPRRGQGCGDKKAGCKNCEKSSHQLCIVSRKLNTPRSLKSRSGTVKRGNLPPINM